MLKALRSISSPINIANRFINSIQTMAEPTAEGNIRFDYSEIARNYIAKSGGATISIIPHLLDLLPPVTATSIIHDNACGPGPCSSEIISRCKSSGVKSPIIHATDSEKSMIECYQTVSREQGWSNVTAQLMDGTSLSFPDETFTHSLTNFGIFAFPNAVKGASEIYRTLKPSGTAILTTWKTPRTHAIMNDARRAIRPGLPAFASALLEWTKPEKLVDVLAAGGFERESIQQTEAEAVAKFKDVDQMVDVFSGPFWDSAKQELTEEEKGRWNDEILKAFTDEEKRTCEIRMLAYIAIAKK
jgi:ubiquinone/menaquinone biosynthesis C-methylase UbiE